MTDQSAVSETASTYLYSRDALPISLGLVPLGGSDRLLLTPTSIGRLRAQLRAAAHLVNFDGDDLETLLDRTQAAAARALGFGVGGEVQFRATSDGSKVQVWVRDLGSEEPHLPQELLALLHLAGTVSLFHDASGTTIVLGQER